MEAEGQGQVKETLCDRGEVYLKNRESEAKTVRKKRVFQAPEVRNDTYCSFTGSHDGLIKSMHSFCHEYT